jgi:hypothetical protein
MADDTGGEVTVPNLDEYLTPNPNLDKFNNPDYGLGEDPYGGINFNNSNFDSTSYVDKLFKDIQGYDPTGGGAYSSTSPSITQDPNLVDYGGAPVDTTGGGSYSPANGSGDTSGGAPSGSGGGGLDGIIKALKNLASKGQPGPGGTTAPSGLENILNMLASYKTNNGAYNDYKSLMDQMRDPNLQANRNLLAKSYSDPSSWLNGAEGKALADVVSNKYDRLAAQGGLNANPLSRSKQLQDAMMLGLNNYRSGLNSAIQTSYSPLSYAGNTVDSLRKTDPLTSIVGGLGSSTSSGNGNTLGDILNIGKSIYGSFSNGGGQ